MAEMQKLNTIGNAPQPYRNKQQPQEMKDSNQIVEVKFPSWKPGDKLYSYIGSGNLRTKQVIDAPVNHSVSNKPYMVPGVEVVKTHNVVGPQVGDKVGVMGGKVQAIPKPLKYLPGAKETQRNDSINIKDEKMPISEYLKPFKGSSEGKMKKLNIMGEMGGV